MTAQLQVSSKKNPSHHRTSLLCCPWEKYVTLWEAGHQQLFPKTIALHFTPSLPRWGCRCVYGTREISISIIFFHSKAGIQYRLRQEKSTWLQNMAFGFPVLISQKLITLAGITLGTDVYNAHICHSARDRASSRGTNYKSHTFQRILDI